MAWFSYDFYKVKTNLVNEIIIAGPKGASNNYLAGQIGPANDPLYAMDHYWPYGASQIDIAGLIGPSIR